MSSPYRRLKHVLFGRPLPSERLEHERLNKKTALAVLSPPQAAAPSASAANAAIVVFRI